MYTLELHVLPTKTVYIVLTLITIFVFVGVDWDVDSLGRFLRYRVIY